MNVKKILITGIILTLLMLAVTCEAVLPAEGEVEYTDVVYAEDGSAITLYLDGVGVPKTEAQRAMSTRLSRMAYDYLEVVFIGPTPSNVVARAQWELGQSAGISGVDRGPSTTPPPGIDYKFDPGVGAAAPAAAPTGGPPAVWGLPTVAAGTGVALMAVGRKDGKTLLGIGQIGHVDSLTSGLDANGLPTTINAKILPSTQSVTFYIEAVKTGLLVGDEKVSPDGTAAPTTNAYGILYDSLTFTTGGNTIKEDSKRSNLGGIDYPLYSLPETTGDEVQDGKYVFQGAPKTYTKQLLLNRFAGTGGITWAASKKSPLLDVEMRIPRYMNNGRYLQPKATMDMRSTVESLTYAGPQNAPSNIFNNEVDLKFTRAGASTGLYSFFLKIPVVLMTKASGTNGGNIPPIVWNISTGLGSELYSIDDGLASGGCVLMGIGVTDLDMLEINWEWAN